MKHKTLRTLLCVILTVCFCLSAIVPASAAGLFGGESGIASQWDQWLRSMKDRFTDTQPGTEEIKPVYDDTATYANNSGEFIRIFHLDCGRKYFTVQQIKDIIDQLAANNYTHIELAFGNDGFRFLLDDMAVGTYSSDAVKSAIAYGNTKDHIANSTGTLSESEMDDIIDYAKKGGKNNGHPISVIPMIDVPGHTNTLIYAMQNLEISGLTKKQTNSNSSSKPTYAFEVGDNDATKFVVALVEKYVDYFRGKGSTYFNIGADECGYSTNFVDNTLLANSLLQPLVTYIKDKSMTPMMFNDGFRYASTGDKTSELMNALQKMGIAVCYWEYQNKDGYTYKTATELQGAGFTVINTHNKWYYVAGNGNSTSKNWSDWAYHYDYAQEGIDTYGCKSVDGGGTADKGCMLAYWCDNPTASYDATEKGRVFELIERLKLKNDKIFTAPATPTITASKTSLAVGDTATLSVSTGANATWTSSNTAVLEVAATTRAVENTSSVTVTAVGVGTATVSADLGNGTVLTSDTITVSATRGDTEVDKEITVSVGGTAMSTTKNVNYTGTYETDDSSIATIESVKTYSSITVKISSIATNVSSNAWTKSDKYYYVADDGNPYSVYVKKYSTYSSYYAYGYKKAENDDVTIIKNDSSNWWSGNDDAPLYRTPASTSNPAFSTITFTGVAVGTTYATVAGVRYKINVIAEDLSNVSPLPIQTWITNIPIEVDTTAYAGGSTSGSFRSNNNWSEQKAWYVSVSANDAYGENGVPLSKVLPESMTRYENNITYWITYNSTPTSLVLWSGRIHNDNNIQKIWDTDYSNSGTEFNYVRYYNKAWQVSEDGGIDGKWITVTGEGSTNSYNCTEQLAVYYMIRSEITDEVTTDVADWGPQYGEDKYTEQVASTNTQTFVLLDFAVKYESGTRTPDEFPVDGKTFAFHCKADDAAVGTDTSGNYYRRLNNFRAVDTSEYEVYMVTVTMTSDEAGTTLTSTKAQNNYTYEGEEQVLWAIDPETRDAVNLNDYTSISGSSTYSGCKIGGDPYIRGVEVYRQHGALITYYVRVKEVPVEQDSIWVHYVDKGTGKIIYEYQIIVKKNNDPNGLFNAGFGVEESADGKLTLVNNSVENYLEKIETVDSDLKKMYGVPAQYRYSKIKFIGADLGKDFGATTEDIAARKNAYLYYEFDSDVSFVVDFGLPLTIPYTELNDGLGDSKVSINTITPGKATYGVVTVNTDDSGKPVSVTYTPNTIINSKDSFTVKCSGTVPMDKPDENGNTYYQGDVTYTVQIIPASNVYYEENFMTAGEGWSTVGTASSVNQIKDTLGGEEIDIYGFDSNLSENDFVNIEADTLVLKDLTYSNGSAYHAQLTVEDSTKSATTKPVSFTFTGTGFDLVSECNDKTGILIVTIAGKNNGVKKGYIVDTFFCGDNNSVIEKGTTVYQVPVVRELELAHDTYDVKVYGYITPKAGVVVGPTAPASVAAYGLYNDSILSNDSIIADALKACGITDISVDDVEVVYMDDNSILNGGSGVPDEAFIRAVSADAVATMSDTTADTSITADFYLDAFRVYNPLTDSSIYNPDKEDNVTYQSLFDSVWDSVKKEWLTDQNLVYVEYKGNVGAGEFTVESYKKTGPQNELYLAPGCGIAFGISLSESEFVHVSAKAVTGNPKLNSYDVSSTELYYNIDSLNGLTSTNVTGVYIVTIQNNGSGILAVSGLKLRGNAALRNSSETTQIALEKMARAMSGAEEYAPLTFNVSVPSVARRNRSFGIGISVTADKLDHLTVKIDDGVETTLTPYNAKAVALGDIAEYAYMHSVRIKTAGTHTITVTAYDANGNAATVTRSVEIK